METTPLSPIPKIYSPGQQDVVSDRSNVSVVPAAHPSRPAPVSGDSIQVHIERLSLEGFNLPLGGDRMVQTAFETELTRLFSAQEIPGLLRSGGARRHLPGALSISSRMDPADLGRQIAQAIYEGIKR